ncbi:hypothetical protein HN415_04510 [Candidatus Woesearchaeota archaeon]|jgi:hypothetical protein|nr:hypothetical protein [Candidatus Woesearchaeota archaeon]
MKKILFLLSAAILITLIGCSSEISEHSDELHDHSVEIEGKDMKLLSVQDVADLWEIDSEILLQGIIQEFDLKETYTVNSILDDIRAEYKFSPAIIKDIAEDIKQEGSTQ